MAVLPGFLRLAEQLQVLLDAAWDAELAAWKLSDESEKGKVLPEQQKILVTNLKAVMKRNKKEKLKAK